MKIFELHGADGDDDGMGVAFAPPSVRWSRIPLIGHVDDWTEFELELRDGEAVDYPPNSLGWPICSERMKNVLERLSDASDALEWLPVVIKDGDARIRHWVLQFSKAFDILDVQRSLYDEKTSILIRRAYDWTRVGSHKVFCDPTGLGTIFLTEDVKLALEDAKLSGIEYEPA